MTDVTALANVAALRAVGSGGGSSMPIIWVEGWSTLADGGEGMFVYVPTDTTSPDNSGTIIVISGTNFRYYREYSKSDLNICWFGAFINSSSDSTPALNAALAALPTSAGGAIRFPAGTFTFNSMITYSFLSSAAVSSLTFVGDGADLSILYWPNKTNGITINLTKPSQSIHFRDLSITTAQQCGYTGVTLNGSGSGPATGISDFTRVNLRGASPQLQYWGTCIAIDGVTGVNYQGVLMAGALPSANSGVCVSIQGNSTNFALVHNFTDCIFYSGAVGLIYGTYTQGITVSQCNFGSNTGISVPSGGVALAQLTVNASQFGCNNNCIEILSLISGVAVIGNAFYYPTDTTPTIGVYMSFSGSPSIQGTTITGNFFGGHSVPGTAQKGVVTVGNSGSNNYGMVSGNVFDNMMVAVDLTGASLWNVQANIYGVTIPTQVIPGTGNSVGIATR